MREPKVIATEHVLQPAQTTETDQVFASLGMGMYRSTGLLVWTALLHGYEWAVFIGLHYFIAPVARAVSVHLVRSMLLRCRYLFIEIMH